MLITDELFSTLSGLISARARGAVQGAAFAVGGYQQALKAPAVHTTPGDFAFSRAEQFAGLSHEQLARKIPFGEISGEFSAVAGANRWEDLLALSDAIELAFSEFALQLRDEEPVRAYAEISYVGRMDTDLTDTAPFVREFRFAIITRGDADWRHRQ